MAAEKTVRSTTGYEPSGAAECFLSAKTRHGVLVGDALGAAAAASVSARATPAAISTEIHHGRVQADGVEVLFREAGPTHAPVLLLLHGFANSCFCSRHLMLKRAIRFGD
jgi:hypothetical protein